MSALLPRDPDATTERISLRFSADGRRAACLAADGWGPLQAEAWTFRGDRARARRLPTPGGEHLFCQLLPLTVNQILMVRHGANDHRLSLLAGGSGRSRGRLLAVVREQGFRLLACPGVRALSVTTESGDISTIAQLSGPRLQLHRLAGIPGRLAGGLALDPDGRRVAFTRHDANGAGLVCLDRLAARFDAVGVPTVDGQAHLMLADSVSGRVLLAVGTRDGLRLAYRHDLTSGQLRFSPALDSLEGTVRPLALAPGGNFGAYAVRRGARSHLYLHRVVDDTLHELSTPAGVFSGTGAWAVDGLRWQYQSPDCPSGIATARATGESWTVQPAAGARWLGARLEKFRTAAGPVEAVVYGDWRRANRVVLAVHGGPDSAWELDFHPLFQRLAGAGCAVVAPNQRGSTGYGNAHADAIRHAWGGPDGDDVTQIARALIDGRAARAVRPVLYGVSYGAFLALIVAGRSPGLWSGCAAVAPFLSGPRLWDEAGPATRALIDRLDGRTPLPGGAGDVLTDAARIRAPLLVIHGDADETIPIGQSRVLRDRLMRAGRREGVDFRLLEVRGAGHDPLHGPRGRTPTTVLTQFLTGAPVGSWISATVAEKSKSNNTKGGRS